MAAIAALASPVIAALGSSLRWKVEGLEHLQFEGNGRRPIMAFWHGRVLTATYFFRDRGIVVMISENFDGEWIARIIERFGFLHLAGIDVARRPAGAAAVEARHGQGTASGFAVDGPRGPARKVQPGAVWLAKLTGNPVVPFHMEASSYWTLKSWDRTQIPRPFSTVALCGRAPDRGGRMTADETRIEAKRVELENALLGLERRAAALLTNP